MRSSVDVSSWTRLGRWVGGEREIKKVEVGEEEIRRHAIKRHLKNCCLLSLKLSRLSQK